MLLDAVEFRVERAMAAEHIVENVGGDAAGGKTRNLDGRYTSGRCHDRPFARKPPLPPRPESLLPL
jgi:hypothetical protein